MNKSRKLAVVCAGIISLNTTALAQIQTGFEDTYFVNVKYTDDESFNKATIQVIDDNKEEPLYVGECKTITFSAENGYEANFKKFKLNNRLLDGTYKIRVGVGGNTEETTFDFVNTPAKVQAMQRLKDAQTETDFKACIDEDYMFLGIDSDKYMALGDLKTKFCNALFADLVFDDETVTADNLESQRQVLLAGMDKQYEVLSLMNAKGDLSDVVDNLQIISVDETYYDLMYDKTKLEQIYSSYNVDKSEQMNLTDIQKKFDGACLCAVIATCDFETAKGALTYYANKSIITYPDMSYYNMLDELEQSDVFDELKGRNITNYSLMVSAFEEIAQNKYEESQEEEEEDYGSFGGSGGGGGGIIVSKPSEEEVVIEEKISFPDISGVEWAQDAINSLADEGCISGDENGKFNPNNKITREEFLKIAVMAFDKFDETASTDFEDVDNSDWYCPYVASGVKAGIINGITDNLFGVGENITRQDAAVMLYRIYGEKSSAGELSFKDNDMISPYAEKAILELSSMGVIKGMDDGKFYPKNNLTRAEAATLIYRLKNLVK